MVKKNYKRTVIYTRILNHIDKVNNQSPFPLWDSYYTDYLRKTLEMNKVEKDEESVDCCAYCKSIYIVEDEEGNDKCLKCNNLVVDNYERFENITDYINRYGDIWDIKITKDEEETG